MTKSFWQSRIPGLVLILLLAVSWETPVRLGWVQADAWPDLSDVGAVFTHLGRLTELLGEVGGSLGRMFEGLLFGASAGLVAGIVMGVSRSTFSTLELSFELLRVIPIPALVPPAVLFLGLGDVMKVAIVALAAFFPVALNTLHGVGGVDETLIETARTFRTPPRAMIRSVFVPAAAPLIVAGLRLSIAAALITTVVAEMIVGSGGIGAYIVLMEQADRMPEVYAAIIAISAIGYAMNRTLVWLERRYVPWAARESAM